VGDKSLTAEKPEIASTSENEKISKLLIQSCS
jgi:hypothetical protein